MANIKIIDLPTGSPESTSFIEATQVDELAESGRSTVKLALNALGNYTAGQGASPLEYGDLKTESTTLIGGINELHDSIGADAYDDTATYNTGDYCIHNGGLYKCNDDNVTGTWNAAKWDATILIDELGGSGSSLVLPESIADEYDDTATYTAGDFVMYQGILYKCNHISATGSFDPTKWDAISATDYINSVKSSLNTNISQIAGDLSDAYSSSRTYAVGDLCILGNLLYKCNTAITTPEAWTPAHWVATTIADEIAAKANSSDIPQNVAHRVSVNSNTISALVSFHSFIMLAGYVYLFVRTSPTYGQMFDVADGSLLATVNNTGTFGLLDFSLSGGVLTITTNDNSNRVMSIFS